MHAAELDRYDQGRREGLGDGPARQRRAQARSGTAAPAGAASGPSTARYPAPEAPPHRREGRPASRSGRRERTGFEPFLIASALGLGLWALILTPFFI